MGIVDFTLMCHSSTSGPSKTKKQSPDCCIAIKRKKERVDTEERKFYFAMMYMCTSILLLVYQEMLYFGDLAWC